MDKNQLENQMKANLRQKLMEFEKAYLLGLAEVKGEDSVTIGEAREQFWVMVSKFVADRAKPHLNVIL